MMIQVPKQKGSNDKEVKIIQEWLCLNGINVSIDSDYGPATVAAVKQFQKSKGLVVDGIVDSSTFIILTKPLDYVSNYKPNSSNIREAVVEIAKVHLAAHPLEVGGQNMGPWVRYYTKGYEGTPWAWCAGFVSSIIEQTYNALNFSMPFKFTLSCDEIAIQAKKNGTFIPEANAKRDTIKPGDIFLNRKTNTDWIHTGLIIAVFDDYYDTIEGNTNDDGSREGYEVCLRKRGWKNRDYVILK